MTIDLEDRRLSNAPEPPYLAVIFTSIQRDGPLDGYGQTAMEMVRLAAGQDGYIGFESARDENGTGITISYWRDDNSIKNWKRQADHMAAPKAGRNQWYQPYVTRIARVERHYSFENKTYNSLLNRL